MEIKKMNSTIIKPIGSNKSYDLVDIQNISSILQAENSIEEQILRDILSASGLSVDTEGVFLYPQLTKVPVIIQDLKMKIRELEQEIENLKYEIEGRIAFENERAK